MSEKILRAACVGAIVVSGALYAAPASAASAGHRCGAEESDWAVRGYGYTGAVAVTTAYGEEPAGSHQRYLDVTPFADLAVRTPGWDAFKGHGTFDGGSARIWERGYRWSVPATVWTPGGTAGFLGPQCVTGSTIVESAVYLFEAHDGGVTSVWGVLRRDLPVSGPASSSRPPRS